MVICGLRSAGARYLGLISSTFSTVVGQLSAARIGRDAAVDWMSVAAIPARDWALSAEPSIGAVAVGIAFHQWADISWALVFFGVLGKWTAKLGPVMLAIAAVPWAILTSAFEWSILVPLFPFWQRIFTLQQPYWIGFLVHLSSASMYPLFAWFRRSTSEGTAFEGRTFLRLWSLGVMCGNPRACGGRTVRGRVVNPTANAAAILDAARECHEKSVIVAVFPELCVSGYAIEDLLLQDALLDATERAVATIIEASVGFMTVLGLRRAPSNGTSVCQ
jgi:hypothetical protein